MSFLPSITALDTCKRIFALASQAVCWKEPGVMNPDFSLCFQLSAVLLPSPDCLDSLLPFHFLPLLNAQSQWPTSARHGPVTILEVSGSITYRQLLPANEGRFTHGYGEPESDADTSRLSLKNCTFPKPLDTSVSGSALASCRVLAPKLLWQVKSWRASGALATQRLLAAPRNTASAAPRRGRG